MSVEALIQKAYGALYAPTDEILKDVSVIMDAPNGERRRSRGTRRNARIHGKRLKTGGWRGIMIMPGKWTGVAKT